MDKVEKLLNEGLELLWKLRGDLYEIGHELDRKIKQIEAINESSRSLPIPEKTQE